MMEASDIRLRDRGPHATPWSVRPAFHLVASLLFASTATACTATVTNPNGESGQAPGNNPEHDALFGPPESADVTPNVIDGLWAGEFRGTDVRLKISESGMTVV